MAAALRAIGDNMTDDNLNSIFDDSQDSNEAENAAAENTEAKGEPDEESEPAKAEAEKAEAKADAEPPAAENKEEVWTKKAVLDERKKRQALEAELAEVKKAKPTDSEDSKPADISIEDRIWQERAIITREMMAEKHEDYEEMETLFLDMAKENPALKTELRNSPNPAKFAYTQAKAHEETKKLSDPEYLQKMKEDIRKEIMAELEGKKNPDNDRKKAALSVNNIRNSTSTESNSSKLKLSSLNDMFD